MFAIIRKCSPTPLVQGTAVTEQCDRASERFATRAALTNGVGWLVVYDYGPFLVLHKEGGVDGHFAADQLGKLLKNSKAPVCVCCSHL